MLHDRGRWEPPRSRDRSRSRSQYSKSMVWAQVLGEGPTYPPITALHRQASDSGVSEWWDRTPESFGSGAYAVLLEMGERMQDSQRVRSTTTGSRVRRRVGYRGPLDPAGPSGAVLAAPSPSGSEAEPGLLIARRRPRPAGCDTPVLPQVLTARASGPWHATLRPSSLPARLRCHPAERGPRISPGAGGCATDRFPLPEPPARCR